MKFFILGDSWGVGEWAIETGKWESIPNTGLDYHLSSVGHTVTNVSAGAAGNFEQLQHTYRMLKENSDYDYIIWFHTESMRDIESVIMYDLKDAALYFPDFDISNWNQALDYLDSVNYRYAQMIWNEFKIPFILIGGQCLVNPMINQFSFAEHIVTSWLAELLNLKFVPPKNTLFSWPKIKRTIEHYGISQRQFIIDNLDDLNKATLIQKLAKDSPLFPDNQHPSGKCFQLLAHRILDMINNKN